MAQILLAVLAIVMFAAVAAAGINYVNFDSGRRFAGTQMVSAGFAAWEHAYTAYRIANRAAPYAAQDLEPYLPAGQMKSPQGFSWSFGRDGAGSFVCLSGQTRSETDMAAIARLLDYSSRVSSIAPSGLALGPACGASGDFTIGNPAAVTYRLTR